MQQRLLALCGTCGIDAAVGHLALSSMNSAAALRTIFGHAKGLTIRAVFGDLENVRDDFAGALDQHSVADLQAQTLDFVHIVECGTADSDAANLHRLEHPHPRECAGSADFPAKSLAPRGPLPPREIISKRPG